MNLEDYAVTDSTRETYRHQLDVFRRWLNGREFDSLEPSAQDAICAEYVHARYEDGIAPSTIRQFAFAVAYYAKQAGRPSPIGPKSSNSIKGASRKGRSRGTGQRRGINRFTLERMAKAAVDGSTKGYRDAALLRVGYDVLAPHRRASSLERGRRAGRHAHHPCEQDGPDREGSHGVSRPGHRRSRRTNGWSAGDTNRDRYSVPSTNTAGAPHGPYPRKP